MALQVFDPDRITAIELRWRLADEGYDVEKIEELSTYLKVDLLEILAGWAPALAKVMRTPKVSWWRRFLQWRKSNMS
jgi:hypothetical protein